LPWLSAGVKSFRMLNMSEAVDRAFRILDLLSRSPEPLTGATVARRLRLPRSTVHGLLGALRDVGAVEVVRGRYRLGTVLGRLAATSDLRRRWRPVLERLAEQTGETVFLGQVAGSRVNIIDLVTGRGPMVVSAPVGSRVPATAGAIGKVVDGAAVAVDEGEYLEGVNAVAAAAPGVVIWVAGFAGRLAPARLPEVARAVEAAAGGP
jgi:DNA-binding transcriptional ArsR family regulator